MVRKTGTGKMEEWIVMYVLADAVAVVVFVVALVELSSSSMSWFEIVVSVGAGRAWVKLVPSHLQIQMRKSPRPHNYLCPVLR